MVEKSRSNVAEEGTAATVAVSAETDLRQRLEGFCLQVRPLFEALRREREAPGRYQLNSARLMNAIAELESPITNFRSQGLGLNPWVAAGIGRNEVRNTAVLASLLRPELGGLTARDFLRAILAQVDTSRGCFLPSAEQLASHYSVACEQCPVGELRDRIDLLIEGVDFLLGIEVKIDAGLGERQLERYIASLERRAGLTKKRLGIVFLAPFPSAETHGIGHLSWRHVVRAARTILPRNLGEHTPFTRLVEQFSEHVSAF